MDKFKLPKGYEAGPEFFGKKQETRRRKLSVMGNAEVDFDVIIVGYGPVGITCSLLLAQRGISVCVVERHATRYDGPRAGHIDGETMRTYQALGVAKEFELLFRVVTEFEIRTVKGETLQKVHLSDSGVSGWKSDYFFYQPIFEEILDARGKELGVQVRMNTSAVDISEGGDTLALKLCTTSNPSEESVLRTRYIIGCDGTESFVRNHLGIVSTNQELEHEEYLVVDVKHGDSDREIPMLDSSQHFLNGERPFMAIRWGAGKWSRWEFARLAHETVEQMQTDEVAWRLLAPFEVNAENALIQRRGIFKFGARMATQWRKNRVFLMGDAAHVMPPHLGQGLCSGLRDAVNLAWKLQLVLKQGVNPAILDTYQSERMSHVQEITERAINIGENVGSSDPNVIQGTIDALRQARDAPPPPIPRFPHFGDGIFATDASDGVARRPSIQARVIHDGTISLLDDILGQGWRLITRTKLSPEIWNEKQRQIFQFLPITVAHVSRGDTAEYVDLDGDYDVWYKQHGRKYILVRPDNYVYGATEKVAELPKVIDQLITDLGLADQLDSQAV